MFVIVRPGNPTEGYNFPPSVGFPGLTLTNELSYFFIPLIVYEKDFCEFSLKSAPFYIDNITYLFTKQAILMRNSAALSLLLPLGFFAQIHLCQSNNC